MIHYIHVQYDPRCGLTNYVARRAYIAIAGTCAGVCIVNHSSYNIFRAIELLPTAACIYN